MLVPVCTRFTRRSLALVNIFRTEACILPAKGFQWSARKLQNQTYGALFKLSYWCASVYPLRVLQSGEVLWGLVTEAAVLSVFSNAAGLVLRRYLAWCFLVPLQEFAQILPDSTPIAIIVVWYGICFRLVSPV